MICELRNEKRNWLSKTSQDRMRNAQQHDHAELSEHYGVRETGQKRAVNHAIRFKR